MTRNRWIVVAVITLIAFGALGFFSSQSRIDVSGINTNSIIPANSKAGGKTIAIGDHVYGNPSGKVLLVEYGDLQCPSCGALHPQLKPLLDYYKDQLSFVFRNFPLTTIHPNALAAATAAEAAGLQGNDHYWAMNNDLYDKQDQWVNLSAAQRTAQFKLYASDINLDVNRFMADLSNKDIQTKIQFDEALGQKLNVNATPTLYLQGQKLEDAAGKAVQGDPSELETDIRNAIKTAGLSVPDKTYKESQSS